VEAWTRQRSKRVACSDALRCAVCERQVGEMRKEARARRRGPSARARDASATRRRESDVKRHSGAAGRRRDACCALCGQAGGVCCDDGEVRGTAVWRWAGAGQGLAWLERGARGAAARLAREMVRGPWEQTERIIRGCPSSGPACTGLSWAGRLLPARQRTKHQNAPAPRDRLLGLRRSESAP
jgi:hypothetical protein